MNLHGLVTGIISGVNPPKIGVIRRSTGYTTDASGRQIPQYRDFTGIEMQVQPLSSRELLHADNLSIGGTLRSIHVNGEWEAVVRSDGRGGDLFLFDGQTWLAVQVMESWGSWSRIMVQLQLEKSNAR